MGKFKLFNRKNGPKKKKGKNIYQSLIVYFILLAVIPTIVSASACLVITDFYRQETDRTLGNEIISHVSAEVDYIFGSMMNAGNYVADNYDMQVALRTDFSEDKIKKSATEVEIDAEVFTSNLLDSTVAGISVIGENGCEFKSHAQAFLDQDHTQQYWYKAIINNEGYVWFPPHDGRFANISDGRSYVTCGRSLHDKATGEILGVLIIDIEEAEIQHNLSFEYGTDGYILITNETNDIVCSSNGIKGKIADVDKRAVLENGGTQMQVTVKPDKETSESVEAFVTYRELESTDWDVIGVIASNALSTWWRTLVIVELLVVGVVLFFAISFAFRASGRIVKPINRLQKTMSYVEMGNLDISIETETYYNEISTLARQFNIMVSRIKSLLDDVYNKQQKLRSAELTALQFQINPHFLYNTFDSVLWLNRAGRKEDVETMVDSLATFFRIGVSKGEATITVREEILHLKSYLDIQKIRYRERLEYTVEVSDEVLDCKIPKLTLQPLAENAIYHGIDMNDQEGEISVKINRSGERIIIVISDTGKGMSEEQTDKLNRMLRGERTQAVKVGYGIRNVYDRLDIIYEGRTRMYYESEEEEGTSVIIEIPVEKKSDEIDTTERGS